MSNRTLLQSFADATDGIVRTFREQRNFRTHVVIAALAVALAAVLRFSSVRWAILALTIASVLVAELANTALERALDAVSPDHSDAARAAKHAAAAAVLIASIAALVVGAWLYAGALAER